MGNDYKSLEEQYTNTRLLIGLKSNGRLKELNAILQCLGHIKILANYTKYKFDNVEDIKIYKSYHKTEKCLTDSFKSIIEKIWPKDVKGKVGEALKTVKKVEESKEFMEMVYSINPNYNENQEFLFDFIILRLHQELNKVQNQKKQVETKILPNQGEALKNYYETVIKQNQSKISDHFFGTNYTLILCCGCQKYLYKFTGFINIYYSLDLVSNYKLTTCRLGNNPLYINKIPNFSEVNIYDCLLFSQQIINCFQTCTNCKYMTYNYIKNAIYASPIILTIIFNRNVYLPNICFSIEEQIDISQFVEYKVNTKYELIGIIYSTNINHFIAFSKNPIDKKWYCYDDDKVEVKNNFYEICATNTIPYTLFYQRA